MHTHDYEHPSSQGRPARGRGRGAGGRRAAYDEIDAGPMGWGPPGGHRGRGRGRGGRGRARARRGDVRAAVLVLLAERPMHGYEIIQELSERTGGTWRPSPGSVYPTLQMLEEQGLVVGEEADGKRRFTLTDDGRTEVDEREGPAPWEQVTKGMGPNVVGLRDSLAQLVAATKQMFRAGDDDQQKRAAEVLDEARRKIYGILSEDR